ncbi:hypothetical protein [Burkholderia gladioli]|uniref:hypothetical protein n=1 Tax=Burkholderia gladioli TaxID=28095 RepID=UPI00163EDE23|nr:hypothetical protein [Burkholderia gladioli]
MQDEVGRLNERQLLSSSVEDLVNYLVDKYQIEVPSLDVERAVADQQEATLQPGQADSMFYGMPRSSVPGILVTLEVPFSGYSDAFRIRPSTFSSLMPQAQVEGNRLILTVIGVRLSTQQVQQQFDSEIENIQQHLNWLRSDMDGLNTQLPLLARQAIDHRKAALLANRNLVAGLKFNLKARPDALMTYAAPIKRKRLEPQFPPASTRPFKPEPVLPDEDYENILKIVHDVTLNMERSPATFSHLGEEDIRQFFLLHLNGHYEGKATGETFNAGGKTDILIRDEGRNIFIAECKFWRGEKTYLATIDQLLSYLSWRDTKAAILVFNKNRNLSTVLEKIKASTPQHVSFKTGPKIVSETRFRYVFGQRDDPNREVILTVMVFDIPAPREHSSNGLA